MEYHLPVLLNECLEGLKIQPSGIYVDATYGGGGHSKPIIERLDDNGHLFAFDRDEDARMNVPDDERITFIQANYRHLDRYLEYYGVEAVDGILADLGVSSYQIDNPERGFSYRKDQLLDMRMNRQQMVTAADVLMQYSREELTRVLGEYGEVRNAKTLAGVICDAREHKVFRTVADLLPELERCSRGNKVRYYSQVFQALRIEVNREMESLHVFMSAAIDALAEGGRLVVITYHSVEDRIVKRWMKAGNRQGKVPVDDYGNREVPLKLINKKPILPTQDEIRRNRRARSAKLRIAEKQYSA